ncbi:hypothetical protein F5Y16DRAFT_406911 [Xylariaceae sp. FL0255]|nr:hypothetical protein F5Y16DRAFT_406911 [Xylariaceae sp. FL0255]
MAPPAQPVASPESVTGSSDGQGDGAPNTSDIELQRKRARDRKSQQAMRDRTKWTIANLTEQVTFLTQVLDQRTRDAGLLDTRVRMLEKENVHLRTQNAALQLSLMGSHEQQSSEAAKQSTSSKPDLHALLQKDCRSDDDISNVVGDIVRSYSEIEALPQKVAVFYLIFGLTKWLVLLDQESWDFLPEWSRPTPTQISTAHAAWIDRIPWPQVRDYLIANPSITIDDFAAAHSTNFSVSWPYDPSSVLITVGKDTVNMNPVFEEHMRQIENWTVSKAFRERWPEIARLIDNVTTVS